MKTLYVITRAELGGAQTHVADLLRGFRGRMGLHVVTGEEGYLTAAAASLGVPFTVVPNLVQPVNPMRDFLAVRGLLKVIRDVRPDIVHAHTSKAGTVGRIAARIAGVPSVFTAHTWAFSAGVSQWRAVGLPVERIAARWSSRIINVSDANRWLALSRRVGTLDQHVTIHNGIDDCSLRAQPAAGETPRIVMVARFAEQKDQCLLLRAAASQQLPFRLTFVGDGPGRKAAERLARELGLGSKVEFLGDRWDVPEILASSSIFALASKWEGFPMSILEAMRAGLPVIATSVGGVKEAVRHGGTGLLVPAGDLEQFREALGVLLASVELRARYGAAGRLLFEQHFGLGTMLGKTLEVYRTLLRPTDGSVREVTAGSTAEV